LEKNSITWRKSLFRKENVEQPRDTELIEPFAMSYLTRWHPRHWSEWTTTRRGSQI